ncbi:hypothetical protein SLE2022_103670 [Rubroshorea leprosula]
MDHSKMERRKTMTMNWAALRDDDDEFFETCDRMSSVVPMDLANSDSDDDDDFFDAARMSFAATVSTMTDHQEVTPIMSTAQHHQELMRFAVASTSPMSPDYDIWMAAPGSINERRKRLLQGMGLSEDKQQILSMKRTISTKVRASQVPQSEANAPPPDVRTKSTDEQTEDNSKLELSQSPVTLLLVRSRSEGDIESFSFEKQRKGEMLGSNISKQRLARTSSLIAAPRVKKCPYQDSVRASPKDGRRDRPAGHKNALSTVISNTKFGAFFLIKNLDTGKEFIVNEYDQDGMWNKVSDLQTGKQLTLEEFEKCVGHSPVVKELMRRENVGSDGRKLPINSYISKSLKMSKKRGVAMLKSIKGVANSMTLRGEKEKEMAMLTDSKAVKNGSNEWMKVRTTGKSFKELSALHLCQEIQAHEGSIWTMKFSSDARFLASAGEDKVIHVWEVQECEVMSMNEGSLTPLHPSLCNSVEKDGAQQDKKKKGKGSANKKGNQIPDYVHVPETVFSLSEQPVCSLKGHQDDVLDLSWSQSQHLLSSSMDKTVRLWDLETKSCIKMFAHNDYVTCIHFNPMDDDYFISGSLDAKVRIWSIPERHVVDWTDLHEMVTAACYSPDGQGALIGSHKGLCRMYSTEESKLNQLYQVDVQNKKKATKKITGFQFSPGNPSEVLVTAADSRIHALDGSEIVHKFKGFRNTNSQIAASYSVDGKYVICASEDSNVYVWRREERRNTGTGKKSLITTAAYEQFPCKDVSVAIPWPGVVKGEPPSLSSAPSRRHSRWISHTPSGSASPTKEDSPVVPNTKKGLPPLPKKNNNAEQTETAMEEEELAQISHSEPGVGESFSSDPSSIKSDDSPSINLANNLSPSSSIKQPDDTQFMNSSPSIKKSSDSPSINSASNLSPSPSIRQEDSSSLSAPSIDNSPSIKRGDSPSISSVATSGSGTSSTSWSWFDIGGHGNQNILPTAWGLVIVTATLGGEIRIYQNFGLPRRIGRQGNLF